MGTSILKGITIGLLVTVLTLVAVLVSNLMGLENSNIAYIVDFGLLLSCLAAGFRASHNSGRILSAGLASGGYAIVGIGLLALYFPIESLGALKIISEGIGLGLLAGVLGAGINSKPQEYGREDNYSINRAGISQGYPHGDRYINRNDLQGKGKDPISDSAGSDAVRARIYELCSKKPEMTEEEEAFNWWEVETKRQLKGR